MAVYNVHALIHLAKDAGNFESLECISSFPFKNFLCKLKRLVRKPTSPLQQVIRRLSEQLCIEEGKQIFPELKGEHNQGPLPENLITGTQYKCVKTGKLVIKLNQKDRYVRIGGKVCKIENIVQEDSEIFLVYRSFQTIEDFFSVPIKSSLLGILKVSELSERHKVAKVGDIQAKCVLLPFKDKNVALPYSDAVWSEHTYKYAVVEFTEELEVEIVPVKWLTNSRKECLWPNFKSGTKLKNAVTQMMEPTKAFKAFPVKVMYQTDNYLKAREKLTLAEETSDLQTEAEDEAQKRKRPRRINPRYESDSETDDDEVERSKKKRTSPRKKALPPLPPLPEWPEDPPSPSRPSRTSNLFRTSSPIPSNSTRHHHGTPSLSKPSKTVTCTSEISPVKLGSVFDKKKVVTQPTASEIKILTCLEGIKTQVHQNTKLLQAILKKESNLAVSNDDGPQFNCTIFPLGSRVELNELEDRIKDPEILNQLVRSLSTIGGETLKSTVRRVLTYIFKNELAVTINWIGKGGKIALSTLNVKDALTRTVRRNKLTAAATDSEIFAIAKDWFRFANDRAGGRMRREEKKKKQHSQTTEAERNSD